MKNGFSCAESGCITKGMYAFNGCDKLFCRVTRVWATGYCYVAFYIPNNVLVYVTSPKCRNLTLWSVSTLKDGKVRVEFELRPEYQKVNDVLGEPNGFKPLQECINELYRQYICIEEKPVKTKKGK